MLRRWPIGGLCAGGFGAGGGFGAAGGFGGELGDGLVGGGPGGDKYCWVGGLGGWLESRRTGCGGRGGGCLGGLGGLNGWWLDSRPKGCGGRSGGSERSELDLGGLGARRLVTNPERVEGSAENY